MIKKFIFWLSRLFSRKAPNYLCIPEELNGHHDCALRALYITLPNTPVESLTESFTNCCDWWPHKGVTNKEFNIALAFLKLQSRFKYVASESITLGHLVKRKKETFIALIYGHYTVVSQGIVLDGYNYSPTQKVYCYWKLK